MRTTNKVNKMKNEKAVMPMRSVNANPGKYVSIITNFGCHYTCPECIVRNNGLKMSETDDFSTQEPLNKVLCKERPEWVSVSGGGDPLFHWKDHWSFYEGLFHTAERRNVKLEMHTSYLPDSPEVQDFPLNWFERVVYHIHKFDDLLHVKRKFGEIVRRLTPTECERLQGYPDGWTNIGEWTDTKGKKHKTADTPRYKALGNSIALPQWFWIAQKMRPYLKDKPTLGSLFDGIGGFPLVWETAYGAGTAVWASEIEEFPIAVTKRWFGNDTENESNSGAVLRG